MFTWGQLKKRAEEAGMHDDSVLTFLMANGDGICMGDCGANWTFQEPMWPEPKFKDSLSKTENH